MAKVFMFFAAQRIYKHFSLPYIGKVDSMLESDFLMLKDKKRYHCFSSNGVFGCQYPTEEDDWCTTEFEMVKMSIEDYTCDFTKQGLCCLDIEPGIKKVNIEIKLRSVKDPAHFNGYKTGYEKMDTNNKHITLSFLTHIDEGNNYLYGLLTYRVKYILATAYINIDTVEKTYNRYRNYAIDFNVNANKLTLNEFRNTIVEHGIYINKTIIPDVEKARRPLIPWIPSLNINTINNKIMSKKIDNTVVLNMEPIKTNNTIIETKKTNSPANTIKLQIEPSKPLKYHETDKFKKEMEAYEYKIKDDEVVLLKIKNPSEKMIIPDSVNIIEDEAFGYYLSGFKTKVKEVYIPNSVIKIGKGLFKNNAYIEKVTMDCPIRTITEETFYCAVSLKEIKLPKTIRKIEKNAFVGLNTSKIDGPKNVEISKEAFSDEIDYYADGVKHEKEEKQVIQLKMDKPQIIPYSQRVKTEEIESPEVKRLKGEIEKIQNQLDSIRKEVYAPMDAFKSEKVLLDEKIQSLNNEIELLNININKYKNLIKEFKSRNRTNYKKTIIEKDGVLIGIASGVKEVFIPKNIKKIELNQYQDVDTVVFEKGSKLENFEDIKWFKNVKYLVLPDCFREIKFSILYPFTSVLYIYIPSSYKYIYKDFQYMQSLTYIEFERNEKDYKLPLRISDNGISQLKSLKGIILPYGVENILKSTFFNCESLEDVILPNYVAKVELSAFSYCKSLKYLNFAQRNYNKDYIKRVSESISGAHEDLKIFANKTYMFLNQSNVTIFADNEEEKYLKDKEEQLHLLKEKIRSFRGDFINTIFSEEKR